jgi:O-antigen/teichoic acid export membrane protein
MRFGPADPSQSAPFRLSDLLSPLLQGTLKVALLRLAGVGLSFGLSAAMAHWLSVAEFGTYSFVLSWIGLLAMVGTYGLDRVMVRDVSVYHARAAWDLLRGILRWANAVALLVSSVLFALVLLVRSLPSQTLPGSATRLWLIGGLCIPIAALAQVQQSTLRGLRRLASSQLAEVVLQPSVTLLIAAVLLWAGAGRLTVAHALIAYTLAVGLGLAVSGGLVFRALPRQVRGTPPLVHHRVWLVSASHMFLLTSLNAVNGRVDTLALGMLKGPEAVGIYSAAQRGAALIPLALNMAVIAMAPNFASLHAKGEQAALQHLVTRMSQLVLLGGVPIAAGMILFGRWFLLLFGSQYTGGQTALIVLSLGQLANIIAGPVANLLVMTGHERDVVMGVGLGTAANLVFSLVLIPLWGINGAACAAAASLILWNVLLVRRVRQRLALSPTIGWRRH